MASKNNKTLHTSKLRCTQVTIKEGGVRVPQFVTEKGDKLFARDDKSEGAFNLNVHDKDMGANFEPGKTYELTLVETGE